MEREHEEAMRADYEQYHQLGRAMYADGVTDTDIDRLDQQRGEVARRWEAGPHAEHWAYLSDAADDWQRAPKVMGRMLDNIDHNDGYGVTEVEYRSQQQARQLTGNDRSRPRIQRER
ncbi:hypothetical protein [Nocardia arthritidis]|uniref:Uncharacterized protein n=1 Tax=Nocardia arthritidis TaxID=228602 RepID=A0A6G9YKB4_9NOCA|nr:hypothetical protein [Nocardia arthritidis]QIS13644.1 hypothetical protein F5544_28995 [Nocardia arthritidis]